MTIFEPLFLLLVLVTAGTLITVIVVAARGQGGRALRILRRLACGAGAYFAVVLIVALLTPQRVYRVGELQCFDDWCLTVTDAAHKPAGASVSWTLTLRVSSRARRISQSEKGAAIYLTDSRHRRFDPVPGASTGALDARVGPGDSVEATQTFTLPPDAAGVGVAFIHANGFPIGLFIIGENELFRPGAIVRLE
jgi:hypothetical protein